MKTVTINIEGGNQINPAGQPRCIRGEIRVATQSDEEDDLIVRAIHEFLDGLARRLARNFPPDTIGHVSTK